MLAKKRTHRPQGLSSPRDIFNPATGRKRLDEDKSRNLIWPPRGIRDRNQRALRTAEKREVLQLHATNYRFQVAGSRLQREVQCVAIRRAGPTPVESDDLPTGVGE